MTALGPTSRNLVAAARRGLDPSAEVAARVRAKVALAAGAGATIATTTPRAASVAPKAAAIGAGKAAAIAALVGALVTVAWFAWRAPAADMAPAIVVPLVSDGDAPIEVHVTASAHADRVSPEPPATHADRVVVPLPPGAHSRFAKSPHVGPAPQVAPEAFTLAREVELVDTAMSSLRADDPANALTTLMVYDRETAGHGQLAEDAAALEIQARCRNHMPVSDQLGEFDERWPQSVQRARLSTGCGTP
ncbi:MAG: hypothetical protein ABI467_07455 [Kofleriaceae bacterium]